MLRPSAASARSCGLRNGVGAGAEPLTAGCLVDELLEVGLRSGKLEDQTGIERQTVDERRKADLPLCDRCGALGLRGSRRTALPGAVERDRKPVAVQACARRWQSVPRNPSAPLASTLAFLRAEIGKLLVTRDARNGTAELSSSPQPTIKTRPDRKSHLKIPMLSSLAPASRGGGWWPGTR